MRILDLQLYIIRLPFRFAFKHSLAKRSFSENLIVKATIETKSRGKVIGYGEGIPREYVTGETLAQAAENLTSNFFPCFLDQEFSHLDEALKLLVNTFHALGLNEVASGSSWCALELAILDALSHAFSMSIWQVVQTTYFNNKVRYGATASLTSRNKLIAMLLFFKAYGFSTVKLKLSNDIDDAIDRVRLARKIMGENATLRVDANCAWSVADTMHFSQRAQVYKVSSIEQPLPVDQIADLISLAYRIPESIVLDESVCTIEQAKYFIAKNAKVDFNIRISKMGGLLAANAIKNLADQAGLKCHLGAQVGESGILTAAGRIFAAGNDHLANCEGSANQLLLKRDITKENLTYGYAGYTKIPCNSSHLGLGVTVNEETLRSLTIDTSPAREEIPAVPIRSKNVPMRQKELQIGGKK